MRVRRTRYLLILIGILSNFFLACATAQLPPQAAIATSHPLASQAGMEIMRQGGNAFDAAVAVASVLAVVEPHSNGLGGNGFWLLHDNRHRSARDIVIDAQGRAPLAAFQDAFQDEPKEGPLMATIPGAAAGIAYLALNYGKLPLARTLQPAIALAQEGFVIDENFVRELKKDQLYLEKFSSAQYYFFKEGQAPTSGILLKQPALATVLRALAEAGHSGFYTGTIAQKLVEEIKRNGGIWALEDLKRYQVSVREPLKDQYHQMKIATIGLPSFGGIGLLQALNILSGYELKGLSEADHKHLIVESLRRAFCDKAYYLGDEDFIFVDIKKLLSESHAAVWRETMSMNHATPSLSLQCGDNVKENAHTTHYSILDQQGNRVSATLTLSRRFGSGFMTKETGILLNNEMDNFTFKPQAIKGEDLAHQGNLIGAGKKPLSSMAPLFFETQKGVGIMGSPGGSQIPSILLLALLSAEEDFLPQTWMMVPRFSHQYLPDVIFYEPQAFSVPLQHALKARGHQLRMTKEAFGNMQAVFWNKQENKVYAGSDPRGNGLALVETLPNL